MADSPASVLAGGGGGEVVGDGAASERMPKELTDAMQEPQEARDVPLCDDGKVDLEEIELADREVRAAFVSQVVDICGRYDADELVADMVPLMRTACQYDDASGHIASALAEVGGQLVTGPESSPFLALLPLLQDLFTNVDGAIGIASAQVAVALLSHSRDDASTLRAFVETACELATGQDGVSSKCTAAALLPAANDAARRLQSLKAATSTETAKDARRRVARTRSLFADLTRDSSTAVRRAAARNLNAWLLSRRQSSTDTGYENAATSGASSGSSTPSSIDLDILQDVQGWVTELVRDRLQDSVRYMALPHVVELALSGGTTIRVAMQQLALEASKDVSWRVRWTVARQILPGLATERAAASALLPAIIALSEDEEVEVRACVAEHLHVFTSLLPEDTVSKRIVPLVIAFAHEPETRVRAAAACSICDVCRTACDEDAHQLLKCVETLIEDSSQDVVQFNVLRALPSLKERLNNVTVMNRISALLLRVSQVSVSRWRVRERVAEQLRHLAGYVNQDNRGAFESMTHALIRDPVAAVRTTAMASLPQIAARFGPRWCRDHISRFAQDLKDAEGYRDRQLYVQVLEAMLPFASAGGANALSGSTNLPNLDMSAAALEAAAVASSTSPMSGGGGSSSQFAAQQASNVTPVASPQGAVRPSAPGGRGGHPVSSRFDEDDGPLEGGEPSLTPAQAGSSPAELSPFWRGVADDLRQLAADRVSNVRLSVGRWLRSGAVSHVPKLNPVLAEVRAALLSDRDELVAQTVAASNASGGSAAGMSTREAMPY